MWKLLSAFLRQKKIARESDFGRCFGWFIEKDGVIIGQLEYLRWDCDSQFWHDYMLTWFDSKDAVSEPDDWISLNLILRNRRCKDVIVEEFISSPQRDDIVAIRGASVPINRLVWEAAT